MPIISARRLREGFVAIAPLLVAVAAAVATWADKPEASLQFWLATAVGLLIVAVGAGLQVFDAWIAKPREIATSHLLAKVIGKTIFPDDDALRITLFRPYVVNEQTRLYPILRYFADAPSRIRVGTRIRYIDAYGDSTLVAQAWKQPGKWKSQPIDAKGTTKGERKGWFLQQLKVSDGLANDLSEWTLMEAKAIANVAVTTPWEPEKPVALLSFSSKKSLTALDLDETKQRELQRFVESIGVLFSDGKKTD